MPGRHWSEEERALLHKQIIEENIDVKEVVIPGRNRGGIHTQAIRQNLLVPAKPRLAWPRRQRVLLRRLKRQGLTPPDIASNDLLEKPERSLWAIKKMWGRQKLANRRRSRLMSLKKVWQSGEREQFIQYLYDYSSTQTPEEIGRCWQVARSTVALWQTRLNLKQPRFLVLQMAFSRRKQRRHHDRNGRRMKQFWQAWRKIHEENLLRAAQALREKVPTITERVCTDCHRSWPLRANFWHYSHKQIAIGTSRYFKCRCRLCENTRRRRRQDRADPNTDVALH